MLNTYRIVHIIQNRNMIHLHALIPWHFRVIPDQSLWCLCPQQIVNYSRVLVVHVKDLIPGSPALGSIDVFLDVDLVQVWIEKAWGFQSWIELVMEPKNVRPDKATTILWTSNVPVSAALGDRDRQPCKGK